MAGPKLHIGKVAKATGLSVDAIRFYQRIGLMRSPPRTDGGYRIFADSDIEELQFIAKAQQLGFSLSEVKDLVSLHRRATRACPEVRDLIDRKLREVQKKIDHLQSFEAQLLEALRKCNRSVNNQPAKDAACPVLNDLEEKAKKACHES